MICRGTGVRYDPYGIELRIGDDEVFRQTAVAQDDFHRHKLVAGGQRHGLAGRRIRGDGKIARVGKDVRFGH